jgi:hypothetical protein
VLLAYLVLRHQSSGSAPSIRESEPDGTETLLLFSLKVRNEKPASHAKDTAERGFLTLEILALSGPGYLVVIFFRNVQGAVEVRQDRVLHFKMVVISFGDVLGEAKILLNFILLASV